MNCFNELIRRYTNAPFSECRYYFFLVLVTVTCFSHGFITGVLWGIYVATVFFLYFCTSEPIQSDVMSSDEYTELIEKIKTECADNEQPTKTKIYKGWLNLLDGRYDPHRFHVNLTQTVLVRLDGKMLRISWPDRVMFKHGFHLDPTLIEQEPRMIAQNIYDLTDATVKLRPRNLARRRWFSRKYPICIKFSTTYNGGNQRLNTRRSTSGVSNESRETVGEPVGSISNEDDYHPKLCRRATDVGVPHEENECFTDSVDEYRMLRSASDSCFQKTVNSTHKRLCQTHTDKSPLKTTRSIYLFARCAREKERWFHLMRRVCYKFTIPKQRQDKLPNRRYSLPLGRLLHQEASREYFSYLLHALKFNKQMNEVFESKTSEESEHSEVVFMDLGRNTWVEPSETLAQKLLRTINLLVSRTFFDFCRDESWGAVVHDKIQNKLATIHLPYFVETLELSNFNVGTAVPVIENIYDPVIDEWGIWIDFDIKYDGLIKLALETRVNLMRIKEHHGPTGRGIKTRSKNHINLRPPSRFLDEEIPESPETSPDEDYGSKMKYGEKKEKKRSGKKMLHIIDKIASSNLFKEASELKLIRKLMQEVSLTRLMLNVEVTKLKGTMTINLAPPPSDRLWYSFRRAPHMSIRVRPQIGDRTVVFSTLSDWIEKKIVHLLEKNLVMPNMDDIIIPILSGNDLLRGPINK